MLHFATTLAGLADTGPILPYSSPLSAAQVEQLAGVAQALAARNAAASFEATSPIFAFASGRSGSNVSSTLRTRPLKNLRMPFVAERVMPCDAVAPPSSCATASMYSFAVNAVFGSPGELILPQGSDTAPKKMRRASGNGC